MNELLQSTDVVAAIVAVVAMAVTILSARKAYRLHNLQVRNEYLAHVRAWACEVVAVMSESVIACELDPEKVDDFFGLRNDLRTRLSALIDRGRWFYENTAQGEIGQWKERAFRGLAPKVISTIKQVHALVESLNYREADKNTKRRQLIVDAKREFTSEIQEHLKPSAMATEWAETNGSELNTNRIKGPT